MLVQKFGELPPITTIPNLIALDTETDDLENRNIEGFSFAVYMHGRLESYYVPIQHEFTEEEEKLYVNIDFDDGIKYLKSLCDGRRIIFHNSQFDLTVLEGYDIFIPDMMYEDSMLLHWDIDTERDHGLKKVMKSEYGVDVITYEDAKAMGFEEFARYGDNDARFTYKIFNDLFYQVKDLGLWHTFELYKKYELPFVRVLQSMNHYKNGIRIDRNKLIHFNNLIETEIEIIKSVLVDKLGDINFNSTKQLGDALTDKGYSVRRNEPTAKMIERAMSKGEEPVGNYLLNEGELIRLSKRQKGKIINALLYNRKLQKLYTTYIKPLLESLVCVDEENDVWVLYGYYFNHIGTRTGRLSGLRPNLQNQPRDKILMRLGMLIELDEPLGLKLRDYYMTEEDFSVIYNERDKEVGEKYEDYKDLIFEVRDHNTIDIRALFIPMPGRIFIGADYSQLELRMMAHFSKDEKMLYAYNNDIDIHAQTRDDINKMVEADVLNRQDAKTTNFFLQYGGWIKSLAKMLGCKQSVAKQIFETFNAVYWGRANWVEETHRNAKQAHYVQTILGRRRNVNSLGINDHHNFKRMANAQNGAISLVISGSSADLIKIAMINLFQKYDADGLDIKLQVHDELLIEVDIDKADYFLPIVQKEMEDALPLDVKIVAEAATGMSWRECH